MRSAFIFHEMSILNRKKNYSLKILEIYCIANINDYYLHKIKKGT